MFRNCAYYNEIAWDQAGLLWGQEADLQRQTPERSQQIGTGFVTHYYKKCLTYCRFVGGECENNCVSVLGLLLKNIIKYSMHIIYLKK